MIVDKSSPLFEVLGGMHNVHVNSVGESALRKGGPYPSGTVFLTDLHEFSVVDGSYVEGALKGLAVMAKDFEKICVDGWLGFSILGARRSQEANRDGCRQTMLRMSSTKEGPGLCLFHVHSLTRLTFGSSAQEARPHRPRQMKPI